jgi:hypothetical protein
MCKEKPKMYVGIRSVPSVGKIFIALLLAMMPIAFVIPNSEVTLGQRRAEAGAQAPLFTAIDLHHPGFDYSYATGISGGQQVGFGGSHALLWRGSAASMVDLNPSGYSQSEAYGVCGDEQVGDVWVPYFQTGTVHAALWHGSAASMVELHPIGFEQSRAWATSGAQQVGYITPETVGDRTDHAVLWRGTAASLVDLHPPRFEVSLALATSGGQQVGYGWIGGAKHALLWRGTAASVVDFHPRGFIGSEADGTSGEEQVGFGAPQGSHPIDPSHGGSLDTHALLWRGSAASVVDIHPRGFISSKALATSGGEEAGFGLPQGAPLVGSRQIPASHALLWRESAASVVDL